MTNQYTLEDERATIVHELKKLIEDNGWGNDFQEAIDEAHKLDYPSSVALLRWKNITTISTVFFTGRRKRQKAIRVWFMIIWWPFTFLCSFPQFENINPQSPRKLLNPMPS